MSYKMSPGSIDEGNNKKMKLVCSRGHIYDNTTLFNQHLKAGDRCPMELSYDRLSGSTYCRRKLKELNENGQRLLGQTP